MTANDNRADDRDNLDDLRDARSSLKIALTALRRAMEGREGEENREQFIFQIGFAVGRLECIRDRFSSQEDPNAA
jgi:hypothetical protein